MALLNVFRILLVLLAVLSVEAIKPACKDQNGKDVDWYIILKLPRHTKANKGAKTNDHVWRGAGYFYADARKPDFVLSSVGIDQERSAVARTLKQTIEAMDSDELYYAVYNDQPPHMNESNSYRAHAKGVQTFNEKQGFWLIHSVPRLIGPEDVKYIYPHTAYRFGQSFFCMTFATEQLAEIGQQLQMNHVYAYATYFPAYFEKFEELRRVIQDGKSIKTRSDSFSRITSLTTLGKQKLRSYAKNRRFDADLYADLVAVDQKQEMFVQTWMQGRRNYQPACGALFDYPINNVRELEYNGLLVSTMSDHSKWALSVSEPGTVCIGDINRQASQACRGGGTMCIRNDAVWRFMRDAILEAECCATADQKRFRIETCRKAPPESEPTDQEDVCRRSKSPTPDED